MRASSFTTKLLIQPNNCDPYALLDAHNENPNVRFFIRECNSLTEFEVFYIDSENKLSKSSIFKTTPEKSFLDLFINSLTFRAIFRLCNPNEDLEINQKKIDNIFENNQAILSNGITLCSASSRDDLSLSDVSVQVFFSPRKDDSDEADSEPCNSYRA